MPPRCCDVRWVYVGECPTWNSHLNGRSIEIFRVGVQSTMDCSINSHRSIQKWVLPCGYFTVDYLFIELPDKMLYRDIYRYDILYEMTYIGIEFGHITQL